MKIQELIEAKQRLDPKCWKGYKKQGTKMKGDTRVNNCVPESADQGVAEGSTNDYFKRRKDEEDRIAGKKAPAKRTPRQTDYEKKRKEQGVAEGLDADQKKARQVPSTEMPKKTSPVLGKSPKQHPFKGRAVGGGL